MTEGPATDATVSRARGSRALTSRRAIIRAVAPDHEQAVEYRRRLGRASTDPSDGGTHD